MKQAITILGARTNNLKNIDVEIPQKKLTVITGLSGSGKSSLAFDTIYAEGQRRYIDTFSAYARNFLGNIERPDVDKITGLSPVISIDQKTVNRNPRSTVGTQTEISDYLRLLYARTADAYSYLTGEKMVKYNDERVLETILNSYTNRRIMLLAPVVRGRKGHYRELFDSLRRKGYMTVRVDGEMRELVQGMKTDRYKVHDIEVVIDKLRINTKDEERLKQSIANAMKLGEGLCVVYDADSAEAKFFSRRLMCPTSGLAYSDPAPNTFSFNSPAGACPECNGLGYVAQQMGEDGEGEDDEIRELCPACQGARLNREALSYRIDGRNIAELASMTIKELSEWVAKQLKTNKKHEVKTEILKEVHKRISFLANVGLDYLSLDRRSATLSGGESQRIRIATQIGSQLVNVIYILDEPSIGLHQRDNQRLIDALKRLRDAGNTIIVVEHDEDIMRQADYIIDIGPGAGVHGGELVFAGTPKQLLKAKTLTAQYLNGQLPRGVEKEETDSPSTGDETTGEIVLTGCRGNNLKNVTLKLPLGKLVVVTGVSGSGKSSLVNDTLQPILSQHFYRSKRRPLPYSTIDGVSNIDKVVTVDQKPIGKTARSNTATYTGVFDDIRALFGELPEAKIRGYKPGRFSFNARGGRCEECGGSGYKTLEMNFLPDVAVRCDVCQGKRYNAETLQVRYRTKNIAEVLDMTIDQAIDFFENVPSILRKITTLKEVGLGYLKIGQPTNTLSGGECQRVKLATELYKKDTGRTLYILDEPTTGLHFHDIRMLMIMLRKLVDKGNSVLIIEHNQDVIAQADHIITLGPEGGRDGGRIISE